MAANGTFTNSVQADPAYGSGNKMYVISKEKMASAALTLPTDVSELEDFFKSHADRVIDREEQSPVVQVEATGDEETS